jgi:hypothetical protein
MTVQLLIKNSMSEVTVSYDCKYVSKTGNRGGLSSKRYLGLQEYVIVSGFRRYLSKSHATKNS